MKSRDDLAVQLNYLIDDINEFAKSYSDQIKTLCRIVPPKLHHALSLNCVTAEHVTPLLTCIDTYTQLLDDCQLTDSDDSVNWIWLALSNNDADNVEIFLVDEGIEDYQPVKVNLSESSDFTYGGLSVHIAKMKAIKEQVMAKLDVALVNITRLEYLLNRSVKSDYTFTQGDITKLSIITTNLTKDIK